MALTSCTYPKRSWYLSVKSLNRVTHICVNKLTVIGSDNGLSHERRQVTIWSNVGMLLNRTVGRKFGEIRSTIHTFSLKKIYFKPSSAQWRPSSRPKCVKEAPDNYMRLSYVIFNSNKLQRIFWWCKLAIHTMHSHDKDLDIPRTTGSAFIKPDQRNPWIKDQLGNALLSTNLHLQLPNFVSCGRDKPSHMTQNLVTVGANLQAGEWFLFDPWSTDQADLVR